MKKILFIVPRPFYPPYYGYQIRAFNISKTLVSKYDVDVLLITEEKIVSTDTKILKKIFKHLIIFQKSKWRFFVNAIWGIFKNDPLQVSYYYFDDIQQWINSHAKQYDIIFCSTLRTTKYVEKIIGPKKIIDFIDAISLHYKIATDIRKNLLWKVIYFFESRRLLSYERKVINKFDLGFVSSQLDKDFIIQGELKKLDDKLLVVPNGVNQNYLMDNQSLAEKNWLVFLGKMNYPPNEDAVIYFSKNIFPILKNRLKNLEFLIVGIKPSKKVLKLNNIPGVKVLGFVPDPSLYLKQAKLIVVPLRFGGGIQNKVLEPMALGKVIISTPFGVRWLEGKDGIHFLVAQNDQDFIQKILDLLNNQEKRIRIGHNARKLIFQKYTWQIIGRQLLSYIERLFD